MGVEGMDRTNTTDRATSTSKGAKFAKRRLSSRLSFGHVVMISAGLLAFLLNVQIVRSKSATVEVLVAAHTIVAGSRLETGDIAYQDVDAGGPFVDRALSRDTVIPLFGHVVVRDVDSGVPLMVDDLKSPAAPGDRRAMSIPISPDHAVGAALFVGDRVDVIAVDEGKSRFVASAIEVIDVVAGGSRPAGDRFGVTVAVSETEALAIAAALDRGTVHVIRSTGAPEVRVTPEPVVPRSRIARPAS